LLGYGEGSWSPGHRHHLARMLVRPLLAV
jgi:hypothetical protein